MSLTAETSVLSEVLQDAIAGHVQAMSLITDQLTEANARNDQLTRDLAVAHQMIEHLKASPRAAAAPGEPDVDDGALKVATDALAAERSARTALEHRIEALARDMLARPAVAAGGVPKGRYEATVIERDGNGDGRRFIIKKS